MDDQITLRQGLANFRATYMYQLSHNSDDLTANAHAFYKAHDIAHVLFGCDISLYGEGTLKLWTIFGTSLGFFRHISSYKEVGAYELAKHFKRTDVVKDIFKLLVAFPSIIMRAKRMHKPWPWHDYEPYMETPICEIRTVFNIHILQ